ncbi:MAG: DEAD/DEAH box helicase [Sphingomonas sp.]
MTFAQLGLAEPLVRALGAKGYTAPTPIQRDAIPTVLTGRDLLGIAQTGTGKTAAFVLPSIQRLTEGGKRVLPTHCRMLVLAPTRELASQIAESARGYGQFSRMSVATVFGGTSINKNRQDMSRGVDILVATPGRLLDLIEQRFVSLAMLEILVLDEADQMLDLGFIHALRKIVKMLPRQRQTLFFSATMPNAIRELASAFLTDPATVKVAPVSSTAERVDQQVAFINQAEKQALLTMLLRDEAVERCLVFTRTKHGADRVVKLLGHNGIAANAIHGNKSQPQRERALGEFKSGKAKILVATDIAARGIDVSGVSHVINFELPNVPEQYVHRIGRTARAGASGVAISFCAPDEKPFLRDIEKLTRVKPEMLPLPEGFMAEAAKIKAARPAGSDVDDRRRDESGRHRAPPRATHAARPTGERPAGGSRPYSTGGGNAGGRPQGGGRPHGGGRPSGGAGRPAGGGGPRRQHSGGGRRSPAAG